MAPHFTTSGRAGLAIGGTAITKGAELGVAASVTAAEFSRTES
jgi:hypothetical protein